MVGVLLMVMEMESAIISKNKGNPVWMRGSKAPPFFILFLSFS